MQESGERKVQGRATWAADSTAGRPPPPAWAGRSPGSRAGARGTPVPAQPPTSSGPCRSLEEASVSPSVRQSPPKPSLRGSRWRGSDQHLQEDLLLGQERQVLEGRRDRGQRAARRRRPSPPRRPPRGPFPSAGPRASSPGRIPRTWYSASSSLDRRLPEPPIAHSSANSSRDAGNFLTSALGPRHLPVPAATAPEGGPRPRPRPRARLLLTAPRSSPRGSDAGSPLWAVPGELGAWSGAWLSHRPRLLGRTGRATPRACVRARARAGCACAENAASSLRCGCRSCGSVARSVLLACRERRRRPRVRSGEGQQGSLGSGRPGELSEWPLAAAAPVPEDGFGIPTSPPGPRLACCSPRVASADSPAR